jgi:hypothetical protein
MQRALASSDDILTTTNLARAQLLVYEQTDSSAYCTATITHGSWRAHFAL